MPNSYEGPWSFTKIAAPLWNFTKFFVLLRDFSNIYKDHCACTFLTKFPKNNFNEVPWNLKKDLELLSSSCANFYIFPHHEVFWWYFKLSWFSKKLCEVLQWFQFSECLSLYFYEVFNVLRSSLKLDNNPWTSSNFYKMH